MEEIDRLKMLEQQVELAEHIAQLKSLYFDHAPDGVVYSDEEGIILLANDRVAVMFGYSLGQLIGQPVSILIPQEHRAKHSRHIEQYFSDPVVRPMGKGRVLMARHRNGKEFRVEINLSPVSTSSGTVAIAAIRVITEETNATRHGGPRDVST